MPSEIKTVLITGASSGIGLATALYLAEKGYSVIGTSRHIDRLTSLQEAADQKGLHITALELDINSDDGVRSVLPELLAKSEVQVLVNNAGYNLWGPLQGISMNQLRSQFETNFFAAARMVKAVLPGMVQRHKGTIINMSSVLGRLGTPFNGAYVASKFALEGLSESLRVELSPLGIRVSLVEPGLFNTNLHYNQVIGERAESEDLPYNTYMSTYRERRTRLDRFGSDPIQVAKVVHKIIRSKRPRFRYAVGLDAVSGILGARLLPERLFQALLSRATIK